MRAAIYSQTGPADQVLTVADLPTPTPGPGEVRVRIHWSGVNPSDVKSRAGTRTKTLPFPTIVPHSDGAGIVDAVGEGVGPDRIGQRVWVWNAAFGRAHGTASEWVTLPAAQAVPLPDGVDLEVGALLGIPALTAFQAVHMGGGVQGKRVLIAGGAGAVGHYAIQMARLAGARQILTTISSDAKARLAQAAGADACINYREQGVVDEVLALTDGHGVDRIIEVDFGVNAPLDFSLIAPNGDIVVYGSAAPECPVPFGPAIMKNVTLRFFVVYNLPEPDRGHAEAALTRLLASGALQHNIAARFPLDHVVQAHQAVEAGTATGNVIVSLATDV